MSRALIRVKVVAGRISPDRARDIAGYFGRVREAAAVAVLAMAISISLVGCKSALLTECQKGLAAGSPAYNACWAAELQRQNAELDFQRALEFRGKN